MVPYYVLVLTPIILSLFYQPKEENKIKRKVAIIMSIFFAIFLILLICRDISIGVDLKNYRILFNGFKGTPLSELVAEREFGFALLNKLAFNINGEYRTLIILVAIISIIPLAIVYMKEAENPILTIALFMAVAPFAMYFSGLRQVIAMAVGVGAYYCTKHKKLIPFILMVLFAMLFHVSSFILFFMYPIYHLKIDHKKLVFAIPTGVVLLIFNAPILEFIQTFLDEQYQYDIEETGAYTMIVVFLIFLLICYVIPDESKLDEQTKGLRSLLVFVFLIQCFALSNNVAMRMNYYYLIFVPILIPRILNRSKLGLHQLVRLASIAMSAFFIIYYFYTAHTGADMLQLYPYEVWQ